MSKARIGIVVTASLFLIVPMAIVLFSAWQHRAEVLPVMNPEAGQQPKLNESQHVNATEAPVAESGGDAWNGTTTGTGLAEVTSDPREITVTRTANVVVRVEDAGALPHAGALRVQVQGASGSWEDDESFTGSLAPGTYKVTVHAGAASVNAARAWQATARWAS